MEVGGRVVSCHVARHITTVYTAFCEIQMMPIDKNGAKDCIMGIDPNKVHLVFPNHLRFWNSLRGAPRRDPWRV